MTTISPMRYEVDIQVPLSTPVPMPPSISSSEALVIWMLRIAMNAPTMPARTAIHAVVLALAVGAAGGAATRSDPSVAAWAMFDMARLPNVMFVLAPTVRRRGRAQFELFGVDGRDDRHAG